MKIDASEIAASLLANACEFGADQADAVVVGGESVSVDVLEGKLEHVERSEEASAGIRVLVGQRQACVAGKEVTPDALRIMAEQAVAMAREAPADSALGLASPDVLAERRDGEGLELIGPEGEPSLERLEDMALRAEAGAQGVEGVAKVESAGASYGRHDVLLAASNGFEGSYGRTSLSVGCAAISGAGLEMEVDGYGEARVFPSDMAKPEAIGRRAGERAVARAGPRRPPTGTFPVIFDRRVSASLVGHLLGAINGEAIVRGSSWLLDALDAEVLPAGVDLAEDPHLPRYPGTRFFDAEGLATRRKNIVEDGALKTWILDLATARKLGLESTANAARSPAGPPGPATGNVRYPDGKKSRDELMREMGTGLIVTSMIGATINPTTGDYSRGASGLWVEKGEIAWPVSEFTIAGNLRRMLRSLEAANDSEPFLRIRAPSLRVEGLTIASGE